MSSNTTVGEQSRRQVPEPAGKNSSESRSKHEQKRGFRVDVHLSELEVFRRGLVGRGSVHERLAHDRVREREFVSYVFPAVLNGEEVAYATALGRNGVAAYLRRRALRDAIESVFQLVPCTLADLLPCKHVQKVGSAAATNLLATFWVMVVESFGRSKGFDEFEIFWRAGGYDLAA
jgi:hypothetical protein